MMLNESQNEAYQYIINNLSKERVILLEGSAGTGKTTLTKSICNYYRQTKNLCVCAIAPTHKSKKIIKNILNTGSIIPVSAMTIASALGKIKEHSYVGTKIYSNGSNKKLSSYRLFILDEVSMIDDSDLKIIIDYILSNNKQLLIIGDRNQIPCPNAKYVVTDVIERADSYIFTYTEITQITLSEIVRQSSDSPIIQLSSFVKTHLLTDEPFSKMIEETAFGNVIPYREMYEQFERSFIKDKVNSCRIIAYTNASVKTHNMEARNQLGYDEEYVVGELLTGYSNIGFPELIIENGEDYFIKCIRETCTHPIGKYRNLSGKLIDLLIPDSKVTIPALFFINIHDPSNTDFILKLIELAEKINTVGSSKTDYLQYMTMKNSVIFSEDVYKFDGGIFTETTFKESHALLFTNVNEIIVSNTVNSTTLSHKINTAYPQIIEARMSDKHKQVGDSEMFADKFKVIEKDVYYGYSITAHKSQGSTYDSAIVDEPDFQKIRNRWNYKFNKMESRIKEKNQIRYVSYTRAKENLYIVYERRVYE
jgi:hypothetical protein